MRGFKVDHTATAAARVSGQIIDKRSFISLPKVIRGEGNGRPRPHLILYGADKTPVRQQIFDANRKTHGGINRCWSCNRAGSWSTLEWDHIRNKSGQRCDCVQNGRLACPNCHRGPNGTHPGRGA